MTTATAWLVSFKLTGIGPFFLVLGAVVSAVPTRLRVIGKAVFYFGLIFFALDLISTELKPLQNQPAFKAWIALAQTPWLGVLTGLVFTALIQSSSVTTGVADSARAAGRNAARGRHSHRDWGQRGLNLDGSDGESRHAAQRPATTAVSNFLFNAVGAIVFFPFLRGFAFAVVNFAGDPGLAVAWAHLAFNLTLAIAFLPSLGLIEPLLKRWLSAEIRLPPRSSTVR